jgi:hypothetical protein
MRTSSSGTPRSVDEVRGEWQNAWADYTAVVSLGVKVFCGLAMVELMDVMQRAPNPSAIFFLMAIQSPFYLRRSL